MRSPGLGHRQWGQISGGVSQVSAAITQPRALQMYQLLDNMEVEEAEAIPVGTQAPETGDGEGTAGLEAMKGSMMKDLKEILGEMKSEVSGELKSQATKQEALLREQREVQATHERRMEQMQEAQTAQ